MEKGSRELGKIRFRQVSLCLLFGAKFLPTLPLLLADVLIFDCVLLKGMKEEFIWLCVWR